jgi:serine/threonine protein kinase
LTDFGDSRRLEQGHHEESGAIFNDFKGSILWMAPEVITLKPVGRRSDIWSLGCTLIELASAQHPWNGIKDLSQLIEELERQNIPKIPDNLSETAKDFIRKCLIYEK